MKDNLVIGGGISGLIFCYYNPEFHLITDELGGLLKHEEIFGNMILWDTPETRHLLSDLGLSIEAVKERVHYYFNGKIYDEAPPMLRREYLSKRMGVLAQHINFQDLALSTEETNYIPGLRVDFRELLSRLVKSIKSRQNYTLGKVLAFDDQAIQLLQANQKQSEIVEFEKLVSTIPAPTFWWLWRGSDCKEICKPEEFRSTETTYFSFNKMQGKLKKLLIDSGCLPEDFRYSVYFLNNSAFHRMTRTSANRYSVHFTKVISTKEASKLLEIPIEQLQRREEKIGQFLNHHANFPPHNIMFLGRHAQWLYKIKVQDIVRVARFSKFMLEGMRSRQSRFNKNFIPFNELGFAEKQRLTEKWILYAMSELAELLDETNWKLHRIRKEIKREKILEEWIDTLKFVIGIADIWGFTNAEIYEAFHKKSDFVEKRFQDNFPKEKENAEA